MKGRNLLPLVIMLFLFLATIHIAPNNVDAVGPTVLATIYWDPGEEVAEAEVKPGQHGVVELTGKVKVELAVGGAVQKIIVNLQCVSEQGWSAVIEPGKMTLSSGEEAPFTVTVTVPSETSYYATDTIQVSGIASVYPGIFIDSIDPIYATVKIKQFCKFTLDCDELLQDGYLNSRVYYDLRICNMGNGRDTFTVDITNHDDLAGADIVVSLSQNVVEINAKDEDYVTVSASIPDSKSSVGTHVIELLVESEVGSCEGEVSPQKITLTLRVVEGGSSGQQPEQDGDTYNPPSEDDKGSVSQFLSGFEMSFIIAGIFVVLLLSRKYGRKKVMKIILFAL